MAFDRQNLARVGYQAVANAQWSYSSADDAALAIGGANYFNDAAQEMEVGDWLLMVDSTNVHTTSYIASISAGVVTVATGLVITA